MVVGVCTWQLSLPGVHSLKEKRTVIRSLKDRIRNKHNASVAETDHRDVWQRAEISVAIVGTDTAFVDSVLAKIDRMVEGETRAVIIGTSRDLW